MLLKRIAALLMLGALISACNPSARDSIPQISAFAGLDSVHLTMTAEDLKKTRPLAAFEGYTGFVEAKGTKEYRFSFTGAGESAVNEKAELTAVWSVQTTRDSAEASTWFRNASAEVEKGYGKPSVCFRETHAFGDVIGKQWSHGADVLTVLHRTAKSADPDPGSMRVSTVWSVPSATIGSVDDRTVEACGA
jgi:hypothetical protein